MCVPVRLVPPSRHVVSPCVSSHAFRCRCPSCRLIGSARFACRLVWAPFCSAVRSFSSRLPWCDCLAFPCRLVLSLAFCLVRRLARRLACHLACSSRSRSSSHSVLPRGLFVSVFMSVPVFAPFRPARRSFLFAYSVSVHVSVVWRGCASWTWSGDGLLLSSYPSHHCSYSLLAHSLRDGGGRMKSWGAVSCCSSLVPSLLMSHRSSHHVGSPRPHCVLSSPHPRSKKSGNGDGGEI